MAGAKKILQHKNQISHDLPWCDEFITIMSNIFRCARWFGIAGSGRYYWKIWGTFLLIVLIVVECCSIWKVVKALAGWAVSTNAHRSVTARLAGAMLYAVGVLSIVFCWKLSSSWKSIAEFWILLERVVSAMGLPVDKNLKRNMNAAVKLFIIFGSAEHLISIASIIDTDCPPSLWLKKYILISHGFLLLPSDYSVWVGLSLFFLSTFATILWHYQDLFLILISFGLTSRYRRMNKYVSIVCAKNKREENEKDMETYKLYTWRRIREAYVKQALLVRKLDKLLGSAVLLSSSSNFYFICLQLFLGITQGMSDTTLKQVYYLVSLIWLVIRTSLVVLSAAEVNVCSKSVLPYLYECRTEFYNLEIERLQYQLTKDNIALSGMGFFFLTKTLLLQMAGAVVTYELVLIQFDVSDRNGTNVTIT